MAINKNINDDITLAYLLKKVKTDVLSALNTAVEKIYVALGNKVDKAGDTMTGNLEIDNTSPGTILKNTAMDVTDSSYTQNNSTGFRLRDKNGKNVAIIADRYLANGTTGLWMTGWKTVNGTAISNNLSLYVDKDGNRVVDLYPSVWRAALNVVDKSGDTMTGSLTIQNSEPRLYFKDPEMDTTLNTPTSSNNILVIFQDKNGRLQSRIQSQFNLEGTSTISIGSRRVVSGADISNNLDISVEKDGSRVISVTSPAAWRTALGLGTNGAFPITVAQGGSGQTGITTTTTASSIITAASGITISAAEYCQWGKVAQLQITWKSSNTISVGADGNAANVTIGTIASGKRPKINSAGTSYGDNGGPAFYLLGAGGSLQLGACGGTGATRTIAANTTFNCHITYLLP